MNGKRNTNFNYEEFDYESNFESYEDYNPDNDIKGDEYVAAENQKMFDFTVDLYYRKEQAQELAEKLGGDWREYF